MKAGQRQYLLGLGSNLGDRAYYIEQAVMALAALPETQILAISEAFDSDPVGFKEQDNFLNICLAVTCEFNPEELLATCLSIETKLGRVRTIKDGPRTIDIDVLFYEFDCESFVELRKQIKIPCFMDRFFNKFNSHIAINGKRGTA